MLRVSSYRKRWEEKLALYKEHDILPTEEESGAKDTLIKARDESNSSIDTASTKKIIIDVLKLQGVCVRF